MFQLKGEGTKKPQRFGLASKEEIDRQIAIGNQHVVFEGVSYFLDLEQDYERLAFKRKIGLPEYEWFKEGTGNKNWVLYNPEQFKPDKNWNGKKILKYNKEDYSGGRFEIPVNASSCCGMFSWCTLPDNFKLTKLFDTSDIVDMDLMFAGSVLPKDFALGDSFKTSRVKDMRYMFYECVLPDSFTFSDKFRTDSVKYFDYMFSECKLPKGMVLPETFYTSSAKSMDHMFYEAMVSTPFDFGENFRIPQGININCIFTDLIVDDVILDSEYGEDFAYVAKLLKGGN